VRTGFLEYALFKPLVGKSDIDCIQLSNIELDKLDKIIELLEKIKK
jgi:hypothetical protein